MANIVITTHTAGKCVEVDFGDLYNNPNLPFIKSPSSQFYKGGIIRTSPFPNFLRVITSDGEVFDLTPEMVDTVDGVFINTMDELKTAVVSIIINNLV